MQHAYSVINVFLSNAKAAKQKNNNNNNNRIYIAPYGHKLTGSFNSKYFFSKVTPISMWMTPL